MDYKELIFRFAPLIKKHWLPLSLGIAGMILFAYGLIGLLVTNKSDSGDIIFEANSSNDRQTESGTILVDIEGAVVKPGVYKLPKDSRIQDGLIAAGGLSALANREYIAKNFNLATKLIDGTKIYVPSLEEAVNGASVLNALININTSSQSQLEALPGIGPATATKIIESRPYGSVNDLLNKKVVGSKVFSQIKDKITVY